MPEEAADNLELLTFLPFFSQQVNEEMVKKQIDVVGADSLFYRLDKADHVHTNWIKIFEDKHKYRFTIMLTPT